jgi:hypothetical protein
MNILKALFRRHRVLPPIAKSATIYYGPRGLLVSASSRDVTGWIGPTAPMELLPRDAGPYDIGTRVITSIRGSRDRLTEEELKAHLGDFFSRACVSSWDELERGWRLIHAYIEPGEDLITIRPTSPYETGGYVTLEGDPVYHNHVEPDEVGKSIRQILDAPQLPIIPHEPKHT